MNLDTANETDIREEMAMPLLTGLGYQRGTANDIRREWPLKRPYESLGRKKASDPLLRGRADYVLVVTGVGRWVLEVKAPNVVIGIDDKEQAISYARHPEVAGTYAAILNGRRFVLMHNSQRSDETPILDLEISSVELLKNQLEATLSPAAIRRDLRPAIIDINRPIAEGFRSRIAITKGSITSTEARVECNLPSPTLMKNLEEAARSIRSRRSTIIGGEIWRDSDSVIKAKLIWDAPHEELLRFIDEKGFSMIEFVSLSSVVSQDASEPTIFDVAATVNVAKGERIFDIRQWQSVVSENAVNMTFYGQGEGHLVGNNFRGKHLTFYDCKIPALPQLEIRFIVKGTFNVELDTR